MLRRLAPLAALAVLACSPAAARLIATDRGKRWSARLPSRPVDRPARLCRTATRSPASRLHREGLRRLPHAQADAGATGTVGPDLDGRSRRSRRRRLDRLLTRQGRDAAVQGRAHDASRSPTSPPMSSRRHRPAEPPGGLPARRRRRRHRPRPHADVDGRRAAAAHARHARAARERGDPRDRRHRPDGAVASPRARSGRLCTSRSICYQGAAVVAADGEWLLHVPIELELAIEAIAAVEAEGYDPNVYVDDELYVSRMTPGRRGATRTSSSIAIHAVGDVKRVARPSRRRRSSASATRTSSTGSASGCAHASATGCGSRSRCRTSSSSRRSASRRARGSTSSPGGSASRASRRSRSATARTTSSSSSGPATAIAVENAHERVKAVADWICPPAAEEGVAAVLEALLDSRAMIDLRAARADPDRFRAALARKGAAERVRRAARRRRALARARAAVDELRAS